MMLSEHDITAPANKPGREIPILFSAPMVRANRAGLKDVTRRLIQPQPTRVANDWEESAEVGDVVMWHGKPYRLSESRGRNKRDMGELTPVEIKPRWRPGDALWVRETWGCPPADRPGTPNGRKPAEGDRVVYLADDADAWQWRDSKQWSGWRPSIHMPRWACRNTYAVVSVRAERLRDITEDDAKREGVGPWPCNPDQPLTTSERAGDSPCRSSYALLWDEINGDNDEYLWKRNPWVWRIEYANPAKPDSARQQANSRGAR